MSCVYGTLVPDNHARRDGETRKAVIPWWRRLWRRL
jgi:hypothetical protein